MGDPSSLPAAIATIPKNSREEVRVSLDTYQGHVLVDLRIYADFAAGPVASRAPTKKGLALDVTRLPELREAIVQAEAEARTRGLI